MTTAPTSAFAGADLDIATVPAREPYRRIWLAAYPDPLGCGKGRSRFSDPRRRIESNRGFERRAGQERGLIRVRG